MRRNFVIKKVKNTVLWTYVTEDSLNEEVVGMNFVQIITNDKLNGGYNWKSNKEKRW